jgi:hypothetical protein
MNIERCFRSLGSEVEALKFCVRDLKDSTQWLMDGEWKESDSEPCCVVISLIL